MTTFRVVTSVLSLTRVCPVATSRGGEGSGSLVPKMLAYVPDGSTALSFFLQFLTPVLVSFYLFQWLLLVALYFCTFSYLPSSLPF